MARKKKYTNDESFVIPGTFQDVGKILKVHGTHYDVELKDGKIVLCRLRGKLKNRSKSIKIGTIVLIEQWDFHTRGFRGDIVSIYNETNEDILNKSGYIFTTPCEDDCDSDIDIDEI